MQIELIKKLRSLTGSPIGHCKAALESSNNDLEDAKEYLRLKGLSQAHKKLQSRTSSGLVAGSLTAKSGQILEILCETDFVAKTDLFQDFARLALDRFSHNTSSFLESLEKERMECIAKVQENVEVRRKAQFLLGDSQIPGLYLHNTIGQSTDLAEAGCLICLQSSVPQNDSLQQFIEHLCMHVVAAKPLYTTKAQVPESVIAKEREAVLEQMDDSVKKKPEKIQQEILKGKLNKALDAICLEEQVYMIDDSERTVKQVLKDFGKELGADLSIKGFEVFKCEDLDNN